MSNSSANFKEINIKTKRKLSHIHCHFSCIARGNFYSFRKFDSFSPQAMFKGNPTLIVLLPKVTIVKEMQTISRRIYISHRILLNRSFFQQSHWGIDFKTVLDRSPLGRVRSQSPMRDTFLSTQYYAVMGFWYDISVDVWKTQILLKINVKFVPNP